MLDDNNLSEEDSEKEVYTTKQYKFKFEKIKMQVFDIDKNHPVKLWVMMAPRVLTGGVELLQVSANNASADR